MTTCDNCQIEINLETAKDIVRHEANMELLHIVLCAECIKVLVLPVCTCA